MQTLWFLLTFTWLCAGAAPDRVETFLRQRGRLRVAITAAPGLGHYAATAALMDQVRRLGFKGQFEVVYDERERWGDVGESLAHVFPGFRPGVAYQNVNNALFVTRAYFNAHPEIYPTVDLALTGADDFDREPADHRAGALITWQPFDWFHPSTLKIDDNGHPRRIDLSDINILPARYAERISPTEVYRALQLTARQREKGEAFSRDMTELIDAMGSLHFAPYYGHRLRVNPDQLITYVIALHFAAKARPDVFPKGVVVPIFIPMSAYTVDFVRQFFRAQEEVPGVNVLRLEHPLLPEVVKSLAPGRILVVSVDHVPRPVFEYVMRNADVAPVTSGRNSMNLMAQIGRPYLKSNPNEPYHFSIGRALHPLDDAVDAFARAASHALEQTMGREPGRGEDVRRFLIEAREPSSRLSQYFHRQRLRPDDRNDRVRRGFAIALDALNCDRALSE